jgi:MFS family permease
MQPENERSLTMNYAENIWKLYAIRFFQSLIPAYVIERLFWEQRGMTIQMVVYTEIIYAITIVLLEVPTGIIADKWSRKNMLVLSSILEGCMFLILVFATEFWHFAIAIFISGIARSTSSGSENALLYDSLLLNGKEQSFEKVLGRLNVFDFTSAIIAALCGSLLASRFDFELNYWISLASIVVSLGISLALLEPAVKSNTDESIEINQYIKVSLLFFRKNRGVSLVLLSAMVIGSALSFIYEFWQLYLERLGIPVIYFGLFSAGFMLLGLPGNMLAHALKGRFSYRTLLSVVTAVIAVGFIYISVVKDYSCLAAIFLIGLFSGIIEPIATGYLHHRIESSSMRATIDSFKSLGENAVLMIIGLGFGFFSARFDIFGGYGFIALICSVFFVYFLIASKEVVE